MSWTYLDTGEVFECNEDGLADTDRLVATLATPDDTRGNLLAVAPDLLVIAATLRDQYGDASTWPDDMVELLLLCDSAISSVEAL